MRWASMWSRSGRATRCSAARALPSTWRTPMKAVPSPGARPTYRRAASPPSNPARSRPAWNGGGFGSNDPGRERDTTRIKVTNFDALYPLDIGGAIEISIPAGTPVSAEEAIVAIQKGVPWKLRRQNLGGNSRKPHPDLATSTVRLSTSKGSAWALLGEVVSQLPAHWQATALRSHLILYKERRDYPDPLGVALSPGSKS